MTDPQNDSMRKLIEREYRAFDQLPRDLRDAINGSRAPFSSLAVECALERGRFAEEVREWIKGLKSNDDVRRFYEWCQR